MFNTFQNVKLDTGDCTLLSVTLCLQMASHYTLILVALYFIHFELLGVTFCTCKDTVLVVLYMRTRFLWFCTCKDTVFMVLYMQGHGFYGFIHARTQFLWFCTCKDTFFMVLYM